MLPGLCPSTNNLRIIKERIVGWERSVKRMGGQTKCIAGYGGETRAKEVAWNT